MKTICKNTSETISTKQSRVNCKKWNEMFPPINETFSFCCSTQPEYVQLLLYDRIHWQTKHMGILLHHGGVLSRYLPGKILMGLYIFSSPHIICIQHGSETCCSRLTRSQPSFSGKICKLLCEALLWLLLPYSGKDNNSMTSKHLKIEEALMVLGLWFERDFSTNVCKLSKCSKCSDLENRVVNWSDPSCLQSKFQNEAECCLTQINEA